MIPRIETLSAADVLGSTEARRPAELSLYMYSAARTLRRLVKPLHVEGLTRAEVDQRFNPDGCEAIAVIITQMLTPWTPASNLTHLNMWGS